MFGTWDTGWDIELILLFSNPIQNGDMVKVSKLPVKLRLGLIWDLGHWMGLWTNFVILYSYSVYGHGKISKIPCKTSNETCLGLGTLVGTLNLFCYVLTLHSEWGHGKSSALKCLPLQAHYCIQQHLHYSESISFKLQYKRNAIFGFIKP